MVKAPPSPQFYTVAEVAAMLRVHVQTVRSLIAKQKLGAVRVGAEWRISQEQFDQFVRDSSSK
ncbi:MAG: helix-turn-helix domain-containing protein [Methanomicrobiales archaeon]|jgi:excisionase family DNA binding protein